MFTVSVPKAFEQAGGFLRVMDADHPLDASAVHPESYAIVDAMAADLGSTIATLMQGRRAEEENRYPAVCHRNGGPAHPE